MAELTYNFDSTLVNTNSRSSSVSLLSKFILLFLFYSTALFFILPSNWAKMMMRESTSLVSNLQFSPHSDPCNNDQMEAPASASPYSVNGGGDYNPSVDSPTVLHCFLLNNFTPNELDSLSEEFDMPIDAFSGDHFRMFEFKVRRCSRGRSHDWTECPYAHPGEKARRRDPRKYHYSGTACPEFRKGVCKKGDSCEFAHGVFESWLHPARYRTQLCKDGTNCRRRVCFFAHTSEQLRVLAHGSGESSDGSQIRHALDSASNASFVSSPTSVLNSSRITALPESPPRSPRNAQHRGGSFNAVSELVTAMRNVQIDNVSATRVSQMGSVLSSPRSSTLRPGFFSVPSTPTGSKTNLWDQSCEEEPAMERVESGRDLRARIYAKLSKENSFGQSEPARSGPDLGWISELVK